LGSGENDHPIFSFSLILSPPDGGFEPDPAVLTLLFVLNVVAVESVLEFVSGGDALPLSSDDCGEILFGGLRRAVGGFSVAEFGVDVDPAPVEAGAAAAIPGGVVEDAFGPDLAGPNFELSFRFPFSPCFSSFSSLSDESEESELPDEEESEEEELASKIGIFQNLVFDFFSNSRRFFRRVHNSVQNLTP